MGDDEIGATWSRRFKARRLMAIKIKWWRVVKGVMRSPVRQNDGKSPWWTLPSHMATSEWRWRNNVGPGGTNELRKDARKARGRGPLSIDADC